MSPALATLYHCLPTVVAIETVEELRNVEKREMVTGDGWLVNKDNCFTLILGVIDKNWT